MAGEDGRDDSLKRLAAAEPLPRAEPQDPDWPRKLRERLERDYPEIDFRGMTIQEMDAAIDAYLQSREDRLIEWLGGAGPAAYHRCALDWNWDDGLKVLRWIIAQPDCDSGTAIHLLAAADAFEFRNYESLEAIEAAGLYDMDSVRFMIEICERWAAGQYKEYRFRPWDVPLLNPDSRPWPVPRGLARAEMQGEVLDIGEWDSGYPPELRDR
jgi:hypothetical protein